MRGGRWFRNVSRFRWRDVPAVLAIAAMALPLSPEPGAARNGAETAQQITTKLNTTGHAIDLPVPLKDAGRDIGEVLIRINPDDSVLVHKEALIGLAGATFNAQTIDAIRHLTGTFISLADFAASGVAMSFDPALQELVLEPTPTQRPIGELNIGRYRMPPDSALHAKPALFSGYVNFAGSLEHVWDDGSDSSIIHQSSDPIIARLEFDSSVRAWGTVFENRAVYRSAYESFLCPAPIDCSLGFSQGFKRQASRAVYDIPSHDLRFVVGDNDALGLGIQGAPEFAGFSIEKAPAKLGNEASLRRTSASTFLLERRSDVEIRINGVTYHRLQLQAGTYNIRDLPIATGANEIELVVTDASGASRTLKLSAYYDTRLIKPGASEWAIMGGLPSTLLADERIYSEDGGYASGFYRYGLNDTLTIEGHAQVDRKVMMGGGSVIAETPWGITALRGAISESDGDWGAAIAFDWAMVNFRGLNGRRGHSFRVSGEYRTSEFDTAGRVETAEHGVLAHATGYRTRIDAYYSLPLAWDIAATLSARYIQNPVYDTPFQSFRQGVDSYGFDLTLAKPISSFANIALTVGYASEPQWIDLLRENTPDGEVRGMIRLNIRPDTQSNIALGYDSTHETANASAYRHGDSALGRWNVSINAQQTGAHDGGSVTGAANVATNRAEITVSHGAGYLDGLFLGLDGRPTTQRTAVRIGTSIAFADGAWAIGTPIRNGGFAILHPHESIAGKQITVGDLDHPRAQSGYLGPALVTNLPAYHLTSMPVDVADLPVGYSLGAASFDVKAPYKAGYKLEVGSAFSAYAYGTFLLDDGKPAAFLSGYARSEEHPGHNVMVFTNAAGKFGAEGLAPGKWTIEINADPPATYEFTIPTGTDGLFNAGTLRPARRR